MAITCNYIVLVRQWGLLSEWKTPKITTYTDQYQKLSIEATKQTDKTNFNRDWWLVFKKRIGHAASEKMLRNENN